MSVVLVFDDDKSERTCITTSLGKELADHRVEIMEFEGSDDPRPDQSYERYLLTWLKEKSGKKDVDLIACDKELGSYPKYQGLSATQISHVASEKGVPFCQYSRQPSQGFQEMATFRRLKDWDSDEITLGGLEPKNWVPQIASLYKGFELIRQKYKKVSREHKTPAAVISAILDHPESESRIALYGSGDQGLLREILVYYNPDKVDMDALRHRMPRVLGKWLYLSILRFPGILVNQVAAASYLNINCGDFANPKVQGIFREAMYSGPFAELGPWWWRYMLDDLLESRDCEDGRGFAGKQKVNVQACLDPDSGERAGYYCMLTKAPVSEENSRGGISWFPSGADLARIRKDKFEEITALVGMY
jgi:hypothetical protein